MNRPTAILTALCLGGAVFGLAIGAPEQATQPREAPEDIRSYSIGYDLGRETVERLAADGVSYDEGDLLRGIADAISGRDPAITEGRIRTALAVLEREVRERQVKQRLRDDRVFKALHDENLRRSREFLASFSREEGVEPLPGGALRRVLAEGSGRPTKPDGTIIVDFRAELLDGYVFGDGRRAEFKIAELMPGAQQLILQMRTGDHWHVVLPPEAAFGAAGRDPDIGPNETVVLDVKILEVLERSP